jgi:polyisoprenoid-binding protein YceI
VHGSLEFDPTHPQSLAVEVKIDASRIWSGEEGRDGHLRNEDFSRRDQSPAHHL